MADLARIKRNVAKMASMNAPEEDIDGYIASEGVTIDDVRNYRELQPMTDKQKAQAREMAQQMRPEKTLGDKVSEFLVTNPIARQVGFGLQGISNAGLNPAGYVARAAGLDTKPLEAQTAGERATELAGQYGYDAAALVPALGLAAGSIPRIAPFAQALTEGGVPLALTGSTGSALATGIINPKSTIGRMATDILGGGLGAGLTRPKFTAPKQDVKTVKELTKSVGEDALNRDIAEAERTGRNLLEVGGDEVMQAAQQARQQSPEARKIITDTLESSIAEQPARTRGVINEALGTKGKNATIAQVMENAKAEAQPIYKELEDIGDLAAYETKDIPEQNFKRWFEGSKVVDENGQPVEFYHNTTQDFDAFDVDKIGTSGSGAYHGYGFNFARTPRSEYGRIEKPVYLNAKNLLSSEKKTITKKQLEDMFRTLDNGKNDTLVGDFAYGYYPRNSADYEKHIKEAVNNLYDNAESDLDIYASFGMGSSLSPKEVINAFKKLGYDGASETLDNKLSTVVVFNPNQIKSVNNSGAWSSSPSLSDAGWKPESQLANAIKNNDVLADTISRVKRANSSLKNLPDTDFKVVNEARKALSQASMNRTELSGYEARQALNELDPILNNITGGKLAQANKLYQNAYQFEKASDLGRDVFNPRKSPEDLKTAWNSLSSTEKQAAKIGLREEVMNKIGSATNETNALNRFLPENVREKIMTIAGKKDGGRIIDEAEQAVKLRRNYNKLTSGSQTAEKQSLRDTLRGIRGFIRNPWETTVDAIAKPFDTRRNIRMAEYLTNPRIADAYRSVKLNQAINASMPKTNYAPIKMRAILERINEEK